MTTETLTNTLEKQPQAPKHWVLVLTLYLAGIAMGALDMGIVNPARTVIQHSLGVSDQAGVWVFTIYTLAYAAGIPIIGKVADLIGRKPVYVLAIGLFGLGSLGCGLAQDFNSFPLLLASRVVQAIGGGGMMPVATAAVGTIVPPAKRGMALGLVGMVYGVASVFGGSVGSLVLDIAGASNWQWIFYINVPIALVVVGLGIWALPPQESRDSRHLDLPGIVILVVMITALLWEFQHLDFTQIASSVQDPNVWGGLVIFLALTPVFWLRETRLAHRGGDPIINFAYFATVPVATTLLIGAVSGILMMTVMFIPQFAENSMRLPSGAGGYPTIIIGLASAIGAPISGRLTDKYGPRLVLGIGVTISTLAGLLLIFWATPYPGFWSAAIAIFVMGLGLGFLMGAPLTYLILYLVPERDANSGQATLSLIRSMGTTLAPAILVGLLATSLGGLGGSVMAALPKFTPPPMPQVSATASTPGSGQTLNAAGARFDMSKLPENLKSKLQTADVTNIVARSKEIATFMFDQQSAAMESSLKSQIESSINAQMAHAPQAARQAASQTAVDQALAGAKKNFSQAQADYLAEIDRAAPRIESTFQLELNKGFARMFWFYTFVSLAGLLLLLGVPSKREIDVKIAADSKDNNTVI